VPFTKTEKRTNEKQWAIHEHHFPPKPHGLSKYNKKKKIPIRMIIRFLQTHFTNDTRLTKFEPTIKTLIGNKNRIKNLPTSNKGTLGLRDDLLHYHPKPVFFSNDA
jgi:hypothetical protein